jgi:pimeloyl-ACP methyl ester carboxylesterase
MTPSLEETSTTPEGLRLRIRRATGEAIFWIHGYTIDSSLWDEVWDHLPGRTHIGVDLPGHGGSAALVLGTTLNQFGAQLADLALSFNARHIVGLSLGSLIALEVTLAAPGMFATLTMGAPAIGGGPNDAGVGRRFTELAGVFAVLGPGPWMSELWMSSPPPLFSWALRNHALRSRLLKVIDRHTWGELCGHGVTRFAAQPQSMTSVQSLACRTLVLIGEHEFPAFRETGEILQRLIPVCSFRQLPDTGHLCILESPARAAALMDAHFRGAP